MTRKATNDSTPRELKLSGDLSIAFANTAAQRRDNRAKGRVYRPALPPLDAYTDLVTWGQRLRILDALQAEDIYEAAQTRPEDAAAVLARALEFRATLRRILSALSRRQGVAAQDLAVLNAVIDRVPRQRVVVGADGYSWDWENEDLAMDRMLWPVALSAADLLMSKNRYRIRQCANTDCNWLFIHKSSRRAWCDPNVCGNRSWGKNRPDPRDLQWENPWL